MDVMLTHFIYISWVKNLFTSMLAFDIVQFFPSLNHQLLPLIPIKVSFDPKVLSFFWDYLVSRKTRYFWNNFSSLSFNINVGVGQESALSPILLTLYLSPLFHIFEKWLKNLKIPVSILSFVNYGLFIAQDKSLMVSNLNLFVVTTLFLLFLRNLDWL